VQVEQTVRSGFSFIDQVLTVMTWKRARKMFEIEDGKATYVEVWIKNRFRSSEIKQVVQEKLGDQYSYVTWKEANPTLFEALRLERTVTFIVLAMIVIVAAINILSMLVLSILQRRRQIAMMMAMGASPRTVLGLFLGAGMTITVLGLLAGYALGLGGCYLLDNVFVIELPPVYPMTKLPVEVNLIWMAIIGGVTLTLGFLSSFYPAWTASRIDPAEVLRYG
ncbi:MAG: ABC transporter permease, partial [bacterium]